MTTPPYKVVVTIQDTPTGPKVLAEIQPPPNPAHHSPAVAAWLIMRDALYKLNKEKSNVVTPEKKQTPRETPPRVPHGRVHKGGKAQARR